VAITAVSNQAFPKGFVANGNSGDASGCETLLAAPGTGLSIYLESVTISCGSAISVTIGTGAAAGAVETVLIGPVYLAANSTVNIPLTKPIQCAANKALSVDASGAGNVTVVATGYVA